MDESKTVDYEIKTVNDLIRAYNETHPDHHYFDRDTLKYWGERISDMYLYRKTEEVKDLLGNMRTCYCLRSKQTFPIRHTKYTYFDVNTLDIVYT